MIPTREILWNISLAGRVAIYVLLALPVGFLAYGLARRIRTWQRGQPVHRFDHLGSRIWGTITKSILHGRIVRRGNIYGGVMHVNLFWGFVLLFIGTIIVMVQDDIAGPFFGINFYSGNFYLGYKLVMNVAGLALIVGVLMAFYKRLVTGSPWKETSADDLILLGFLLVLCVQGFMLQALRLSVTRDPWSAWSFVSSPMAFTLRSAPSPWVKVIHQATWWSHFGLTFVFLAYVAYSKMIHGFTSLANVFFRRLAPKGRLDSIANIDEAETFGLGKLEDFSWQQLLSADACMHCGRCLEFCPTFNTGKPLHPRDVILEIAGFMADSGDIFSGEVGEGQNSARFRSGAGPDRELIGGVVSQAEIWDCTTCGACMEMCPVAIEHVPILVGMRQNLVLERSEFPREVTPVFTNLERVGSPWQYPPAQRADWTKKLDQPVREMADVAAAGEEVEILFFVGCLGSFDPRNQRTVAALARILQAASINFAILGKEETCNGDPAKRIGNEYLAQMMAQQTIETLNAYSIKKIVTACPHCFNTIKNEYPQLGGHYDVIHHSELIPQLLKEGRIRIDPHSDFAAGEVTFHDPCYLARYNGITEDPREVLQQLPGLQLKEMRRSHKHTFCCGGGGGRMFMEETRGTRINRTRLAEAQETGAGTLAAACPFCMTMFDDAVQGAEAGDSMRVLDIAEMVVGAMIVEGIGDG